MVYFKKRLEAEIDIKKVVDVALEAGRILLKNGGEIFRVDVYKRQVKKMAPLAVKLGKGEKIGSSAEEGYMPNGIRVNFFEKERGSQRAVKMLIKKLAGKPFETEFPMPDFDRVDPNPAVKDLAHAKIALVTSGGIVPKGNPDHIESSSASHYGCLLYTSCRIPVWWLQKAILNSQESLMEWHFIRTAMSEEHLLSRNRARERVV